MHTDKAMVEIERIVFQSSDSSYHFNIWQYFSKFYRHLKLYSLEFEIGRFIIETASK